MDDEIVELRVEGMDCHNCAQSIHRFLERKGLEDVMVNFQTSEVRYRHNEDVIADEEIKAGIEKLGYTVVEDENDDRDPAAASRRRLIICALLTLPLLLSHLLMSFGIHVELMHNGWLQLLLAGPVYLIGGLHFGRSAWSGLKEGVLNMDVLIFLGATSAMVYSLIGLYWQDPNYYFFETAATIITLVLVGNWLEARAVAKTTTAIGALTSLKEDKARVLTSSGTLVSLPVEDIKIGRRIRVNTGDKVPLDGRIVDGRVSVNEAMLTGESMPLDRGVGEQLLGGSLLTAGQATLEVTAGHRDGTLAKIIELVKTAQADKPDMQRLADKISAIFVPVVIVIAILTFAIGWLTGYATMTQAVMNAIAVLLISCPCAMGLATPTAVMVGVGRLAREGILVRGGSTVEQFARIERMVFDKTGTLTTGDLQVQDLEIDSEWSAPLVRRLIYHLESFSSHPIAESVRTHLENTSMANQNDEFFAEMVAGLEVAESAGRGLRAKNEKGDTFYLGVPRRINVSKELPPDVAAVLLINDKYVAHFSLQDELRQGAATQVQSLADNGIESVLLTGDNEYKADVTAKALGIKTVYHSQLPEQKLDIIALLSEEKPTAMVGDGINDAAALSRADLGISLGGASDAALDAARIVLLRDDLNLLSRGRHIAELTLKTIKESLFWAFSYNIVAIPLAALGYLNPMWAALFMAFSDIVVIGNAVRLRSRK